MKKILFFLVLTLPIFVSSCKDKCSDDPCYYELSPAHDAKNVSLNPTFHWCEDPNAEKYRFLMEEDSNGLWPIDTIVMYNQFTPNIRYPYSAHSTTGFSALNHLTECTWKVWSINASGDTTLIADNKFTTKDIRPDIAGRFRVQRWAGGNNTGSVQFGNYHFEGYTDVEIKLLEDTKYIEITDLGLNLTRKLGHLSCCQVYKFQGVNPVSQFPFNDDDCDFKLNFLDSFKIKLIMEDNPNTPDTYYYYGKQR